MKLEAFLKKWMVLIFVLILFTVSIAYVYFAYVIVEEVYVIPADVKIAEEIAFNLDRDMLHFGSAKKGLTASMRDIELRNNKEYNRDYIFTSSGDIKGWVFSHVKFNESLKGPVFRVGPGEALNITLGLIPGDDAILGDHYVGSIKIMVKKSK